MNKLFLFDKPSKTACAISARMFTVESDILGG